MKIAIPTDNGLIVARQFRTAKGFLVLTIELGEIVNQQIMWNLPEDVSGPENGWFRNLRDCDCIIAGDIEDATEKYLRSEKIEIIRTEETIITRAILNYLNISLRKETNNCCCP
jgi:predicted Fe-Mo cluster-binding NifX family protein